MAALNGTTIRGAQPGRVVGMRVVHGDVPPFGAVLELKSGKRYQVIQVNGRALKALVLKPDDVIEPDTEVWHWEWMARKPAGRY